MKILVAVKRVMDSTALIRLKKDSLSVDTDNVKMSMNPFDEIAVEEAVRIKEKNPSVEIIVVSIGPLSSQEIIRSALAMGADRGILIETLDEMMPLQVAKVLKQIVELEKPTLVLLGKQAVDTDNNQVGQMLAGLLGWSQGTFVSKLILEDTKANVTREIDGGLEMLQLTLPSVITTDLRLNEPRYLSLPNIVKAKKKPIEVKPLSDFKSASPTLKILNLRLPERRRAGKRVQSVIELIDKLRNEAKVI